MSIQEIKEAVANLPENELAELTAWLNGRQADDEWDRQIETDAKAGKLDWLADEAIAEHAAGLTRPL